MPRELPDLLADGAPRDPGAPDLDAIDARANRRRATRVGATAAVLLAAVAIAVRALPATPDRPVIGEPEQTVRGATVLPLPAPGGVGTGHANGRPVFVVHDEDGEVRVLDAISPHDSVPNGSKVLAYCTTSQWFVDPWHGSKFGRNGAWAGGPAPYGLADHQVLEVSADTVVVGALQSAPTREARRAPEPAGPDCGDTLRGVRVDDFLLHTDGDLEPVPGLLYPERGDHPDSGLLLRDQPRVPVAGASVTVDVPAAGGVLPLHVGERPAFLLELDTRGDQVDERVVVLDAMSPHDAWDWGPRVLAWCTATDGGQGAAGVHGALVDLWYSSTFAAGGLTFGSGAGGALPGGWGGGPAPTGIGRYPILDFTMAAGTGGGTTLDTITVGGSPLPPPPRIGNQSLVGDRCGERTALLPDAAPADPSVIGDLVVHEPRFADRWWYPTPQRVLGEEPGLPPDELERYLDTVMPDRVELDLDALPALGPAGLAVQRPFGVEFTDLDGVALGVLRGARLVTDDGRDGHGGPVLLSLDGATHWVDPATGSRIAAAGLTVLEHGIDLVADDDGGWVPQLPVGEVVDGVAPLPAPLRVANGHRVASGPDCLQSIGSACGEGGRFLDVDAAGTGLTTPGCNVTDAFADLHLVSTCWLGDDGWLELDTTDGDGRARVEVPRYPDQPADQPGVGHFTDAVFGGPGTVAQLRLECEAPVVVGFDADGTAVDLWGGEAWSDGPPSVLLGAAVVDRARVPLVQVPADDLCGDPPSVPAGIWAIREDGPARLSGVTAPARLWSDIGSLVRVEAPVETER